MGFNISYYWYLTTNCIEIFYLKVDLRPDSIKYIQLDIIEVKLLSSCVTKQLTNNELTHEQEPVDEEQHWLTHPMHT